RQNVTITVHVGWPGPGPRGITEVHHTPKSSDPPQKLFCDPCKIFVIGLAHSCDPAPGCALRWSLRELRIIGCALTGSFGRAAKVWGSAQTKGLFSAHANK